MRPSRRIPPCAMLAAALLVASGCAPKRPPTVPPAPEARAEKGMASWYGKKFHGKPTASGERFDMHAMTAAHRTFPFGTVVRVTDLATGKSVRVRINDRGPVARGRIIDLSYAAARELGMIDKGVAEVEVTRVASR